MISSKIQRKLDGKMILIVEIKIMNHYYEYMFTSIILLMWHLNLEHWKTFGFGWLLNFIDFGLS